MKVKFVLIAVFCFFCFGCNGSHGTEAARNVKGVAAASREISNEIGGFGTLSYLSKIDVTAPQDGLVGKIVFREGDMVSRGEMVVRLENPHITLSLERAENFYSQANAAFSLAQSRLLEGQFQSEAHLLSIEKAEAELACARRQWDEDSRKHQSQETLFDAGGINRESIYAGRFKLENELEQIAILEKEIAIMRIGCRDRDLAASGIAVPEDEEEKRKAMVHLLTSGLRAELVAAQARLEAAEKELISARIANNDLRIISLGSGVIGARYFEEGERVKAGEKIITIMDTSSLYAIFSVREKDALVIKEGMPAKVQIDGIAGEKSGEVDLVYPHADSQNLSFIVRVIIGGENGSLKPGMFSRVRVLAGSPRSGVFLPASSITGRKNNDANIFVINGSHLSLRNVVLGQTLDDCWEIVSGVKAGEIAVLRPDSDMREGTLVSLVD